MPQRSHRYLHIVTVPGMVDMKVVASVDDDILSGNHLGCSDHVICRIQLGLVREGVIVTGARRYKHRLGAFDVDHEEYERPGAAGVEPQSQTVLPDRSTLP